MPCVRVVSQGRTFLPQRDVERLLSRTVGGAHPKLKSRTIAIGPLIRAIAHC
jgi:hypothetical protein